MIMTSEYDSRNYYKKMLDLQEKLRKSEEERIRLEERFRVLAQESRSRHDECMNRLRLRYIEYLEEQRARDERNHKLLGALDKVDNDLLAMTAKTRRLNTLRKQYEAYLLRTFRGDQQAAPAAVGNSTVDSGVITQNEEDVKFLKQRLKNEQFNNPNNRFLTQNRSPIQNAIHSGANVLLKNENIPQDYERHSQIPYRENRIFEERASPISHLQSRLTSAQNYLSPYENLNSVKDIPSSSSVHRFDGVGESHFSRYYGNSNISGNSGMLLNSIRTPDRLKSSVITDDKPAAPDAWHRINGRPLITGNTFDRFRSPDVRNRTTRVLEDELQRYIENIKSLHRTADDEDDDNELEHDHEQNTSGDLLNVTLSDEGDGRHDFLVENKQAAKENQRRILKETRFPTEVEGIINLASDLASRTLVDTEEVNENTNLEIGDSLENVIPENNGFLKTISQPLVNAGNKEHEESLTKHADVLSGRKLCVGEVSEIDQRAFYTGEELLPWDLKSLEKQVREIQLNGHVGNIKTTDASVINREDLSVNVYSNVSDNSVIGNTGVEVCAEKVEDQSKEDTINVKENDLLNNIETLQQSSQEEYIASDNPHISTKTNHTNENLHEVNYEDREEERDDQDQRSSNEQSNNPSTSVENEYIQKVNSGNDNLNQYSDEQNVDMNTEYQAGAENIADGTMHENYLPDENYTNEAGQEIPIEGAQHDQSNQDYTYGYDQQYPDPNYENDPNQPYQDYPDQSYSQNPNEFYGDYQSEQNCYSNDPNQPYENNDNQAYESNLDEHQGNDSNQNYENNENQFYDNTGNQHHENGSNEHYVEQSYEYDSNQLGNDQYESYGNNPEQSYETNPNQAYENSNYQEYETNVNENYGNTEKTENYDNTEKTELCDPNQTANVAEDIHSESQDVQKGETEAEAQHVESTHSTVNADASEHADDEPGQLSEIEEVKQESLVRDESQVGESNVPKKKKDVIQAILDSDTESTIERNVSNTESDFDFN